MIVNYLTAIVSFIMLLMIMGTATLVAHTTQFKQLKININIMEQQNRFTGMWVTADGYIRQELLPNGRYDEARGNKKSAYTGRYEISGNHIRYWDDTGFTATGDFRGNDTLYHGGYIFYREVQNQDSLNAKDLF